MLFIIMAVIVAVMGIFISMITEEQVSSTTTKGVRRWRIARDREGVASRNAQCRKGHLPYLPNCNGPNRAYLRAHDPQLKEAFYERLMQKRTEEERMAAYVAANSNRLRAERRWAEKGTPKSSSIRTKAVVQATVYTSQNLNKGMDVVRAQNLIKWSEFSTKKKERRSSKQERKGWELLQSRTFRAIQQGDSSVETMALYHAARSAA